MVKLNLFGKKPRTSSLKQLLMTQQKIKGQIIDKTMAKLADKVKNHGKTII